MKKGFKIFFLFLFFFVGSCNFAFALEINYPRLPGVTAPQDFVNTASKEEIPSLYIKYFFNLAIWISGLLLLGSLIFAGIRYLTSSGQPEKIIAARQQISAAFLGVLILLLAVLIFNVLNPELISLKLPKKEPPKVFEKPKIDLPSTTTEYTRTSIDVELPLGPAIEDYLFSTSSRNNIRINASTTLDIATKLKNQNNQLNAIAQQCSCSQASPKTCPICPGCADDCTCDTCFSQREVIDKLEESNLVKIDELKEEQKISILLIKKLQIDLGRVERIERFMQKCPLQKVSSLAQFLYNQDYYISQKWYLRNTPFWKDIIVGEDWATFYCPVSGTILGEIPPVNVEEIKPELAPVEPPSAEQQAACPIKIPVGEIIDRTKRITNRLVDRLITLVELDREMIKAVDEMHVLVSRCSSQKPRCCTLCKIVCGPGGCKCVIVGCVNELGACPYEEIKQKAKEIAEIQKKIEIVVKDESEQNIGILPLVDKIIPNLLKDLREKVRKEMKECITDVPAEQEEPVTEPFSILSDCESSLRAKGEEELALQKCCLNEEDFQNCLQKCYLKAGKIYNDCLNNCLKDTKKEDIAPCVHLLNFYCCKM